MKGPAPVGAFDNTELRASDADFCAAVPAPERWPVFEGAAETEVGLPETDGNALCLRALGFWLAAVRASHVGCRVAGPGEVGKTCVGALLEGLVGDVGPSFRQLELTLAGGATRLLREMALFVLVVRDFATFAPSS